MISFDDIIKVLSKMNIPYAYHHFVADETNPLPTPPFIIYYADNNDSFFADNKNYCNFNHFVIELVTEKKDIELESKLEVLFFNANIPFDKEGDDYIENERIYQVRYSV